MNLYLNVPFSFTRQQLETHRDGEDRTYLKGERDIHEENLDFQEQVRQVYLSLARHVKDLEIIHCMDQDGIMLSQEAISDLILKHIDLKE